MTDTLFAPRVAQLRCRVVGTPAPQGSKRHVGNGIMIESSKLVKPWREDVVSAVLKCAREQDWTPPDQVTAEIVFLFRRPKNHYGTGRNAATLKPGAPYWHSTKPDGDKLVRAVFDALTTAGVITDDARIVQFVVSKHYVWTGEPTGALIILTAAAHP